MKRKGVLIIVFLFLTALIALPAFSFTINSRSDILHWTIDSTSGRQLFNLMAKENGKNVESSFVLETSGLLFHSFFKKRLTSRAVLDFGFSEKPDFLWSEQSNFLDAYNKKTMNENLKSVEFEYQYYFPKIGTWFLNFMPFVGFSFVNLVDDLFYGDSNGEFTYFSPAGGIQYYRSVNKHFSHTYYASYSPMMIIDNMRYQHTVHYMNYGAEFTVNVSPFSLMLFMIVRKVFEDFEQVFVLANTDYTINSTEIGFSFKTML